VNAIHFDIGIFTNLSRDHLDYHGSMENYAAAKRKLFEKTDLQYAVINADDEFGKNMIESRVHDRIFAYSVDKKLSLKNSVPTIFAEEVQLDLTGIYARISTPWGEGNLQVPLIGKFNLSNCLAVLTSLCLLEIPMATALSVFSRLHSVEGRMQVLGGQHQPLVIVDYAHTPDALEKVLSALRAHCKGKLFCLFGCGGDRDRGKRPLMAKVAERLADEIFVTNDNPRTENAEQIAAEIMQGFAQPNKVKIELDRAKAIQEIIRSASSDDCVLIAGKGAETYQIIGKEKIPFSDVEVVRNCLS
jgi:UDP-N-acetylmuramoyl-L-alanyl-D-glutamate--2,6-diaminopimelate ligase